MTGRIFSSEEVFSSHDLVSFCFDWLHRWVLFFLAPTVFRRSAFLTISFVCRFGDEDLWISLIKNQWTSFWSSGGFRWFWRFFRSLSTSTISSNDIWFISPRVSTMVNSFTRASALDFYSLLLQRVLVFWTGLHLLWT